MTRPLIESGSKCCAVCGDSFYRKKYSSDRYEQTDKFDVRATCGDEDCESEYRSMKAKESYAKRHPKSTKEVKKADAIDVFLSMSFNNLNSVRYKK